MTSEVFESTLAKLKALFEHEYERGGRDAFDNVLNAVRQPATRQVKSRLKRKKSIAKRRAPRGTARSLIQRVLSEQKSGAAFPAIIAAAKSPAEKTVSPAAVRLELYKGKKERRYRNKNAVWSLATQ